MKLQLSWWATSLAVPSKAGVVAKACHHKLEENQNSGSFINKRYCLKTRKKKKKL